LRRRGEPRILGVPVQRLLEDLTGRGCSLVETHISWVLLGEREVWKIKKPVDFGFLDFTTPQRRRAACEAEVELNRRLSPDVYLGVLPITEDGDGLQIGGDGEPVDWLVHMRRLPESDRADVRLAEGRLTPAQIAAVARRVAEFHRTARSDETTARFGRRDLIETNVRENFAQTRGTPGEYLGADELAAVETFQLEFLRDNEPRLAQRVAAGRVRDGHGDLRLEHVYLADDGGISIIDCIEFNDRFRFGDVCADIAFLAMDLARLGHVELSEWCLAAYAREADDFDLYGVVDFYESYRAHVRAKIAAFVAAADDAPAAVRRRAAQEARRDYRLAVAANRAALLGPVLVAVGGIIATGKSTVAEAIARERSAPIVDADRTRKAMIGAQPTEPVHTAAWTGAYDPAFTEQVYAEVLRRAEVVLRSGRPVVVDASFRSRDFRAAARRLAQRLGVPFRFVECRVDPEVCRARLEERARGQTVSDGRLEILDDFVAAWQTVDELPADEHVVVDTGRPLAESLATIRQVVSTWPAGLTD
jgi:aminoglycoside phosphotransferase family enzyme/predicted kinase